jgi:hypothetical protein
VAVGGWKIEKVEFQTISSWKLPGVSHFNDVGGVNFLIRAIFLKRRRLPSDRVIPPAVTLIIPGYDSPETWMCTG